MKKAVKQQNGFGVSELIRKETMELFKAVGYDQVIHLEFIIQEVRLVMERMMPKRGYKGFRLHTDFMRVALLGGGSKFVLCQNMVWIMDTPPDITYRRQQQRRKKKRAVTRA